MSSSPPHSPRSPRSPIGLTRVLSDVNTGMATDLSSIQRARECIQRMIPDQKQCYGNDARALCRAAARVAKDINGAINDGTLDPEVLSDLACGCDCCQVQERAPHACSRLCRDLGSHRINTDLWEVMGEADLKIPPIRYLRKEPGCFYDTNLSAVRVLFKAPTHMSRDNGLVVHPHWFCVEVCISYRRPDDEDPACEAVRTCVHEKAKERFPYLCKKDCGCERERADIFEEQDVRTHIGDLSARHGAIYSLFVDVQPLGPVSNKAAPRVS